ncbi:unnamed protein product [Ostreobium quekettii]|uniref:MYND-type domain-containing protein n=1 Tax=Ostreobium quekettii TaxID=121088 RepID=A0A8S1ILQ1_9CHLO|nr:unnamed protein product [Ostreobium quekettii]
MESNCALDSGEFIPVIPILQRNSCAVPVEMLAAPGRRSAAGLNDLRPADFVCSCDLGLEGFADLQGLQCPEDFMADFGHAVRAMLAWVWMHTSIFCRTVAAWFAALLARPMGDKPEMGEGDDLKDEANAAFAAEDFERAVKLYSRGIEMDDSNHILFSNRSAAYSKLKRFEEAKRDAERCVELKSDWPKGLARLATALFGMHRVGHAERALHKALELDPENDFLKSFLKDILSADGNQSAKKGMDGSDRGLRDLQQRAGYTLDPGKWKNQTAVVAFLGDVRSFTAMFQPADLLARETDLRMPILTLVVAGAQRMPSPPPHVDHKAVARLLIDAGARIDAKDAAGYTALMYACGHNPAVALAEILLEAGADPNVKSRYGTVALHDAVMGQQLDAVKLLLKHGASVRAADNDGVTPHKLARHFPPIAAAMAAARGGASDEQREITNTKARAVCQACGKENAHKACSKCRVVHYCSRQCQTFHWKTHKKECGKAAAQTGELRFEVTSPPCSATFSTANVSRALQHPLRLDLITNSSSAPPYAGRSEHDD